MGVVSCEDRFRILYACMSRFVKLALGDSSGNAVPFTFICNDGNLVVNPVLLTVLDQQGIAERYDIVVDFSRFRIGDTVRLVNTLLQVDGRIPGAEWSLSQALQGTSHDPMGGPVLHFRI